MSLNGVTTAEDADMAECDGEKVVTMMDVLQEQQEFEEDANAVLGASDDKNCTFPKGYIKRQALYACLTCCPDAKTDPTKRAGVCLACSLNCHDNHELVELYTKRNFRCDCGNPKFISHPCQYTPDKPDLNEENSYNQNFSGLYCTCHRPYPDPESTFEDEMIQCIICEDWLHASHLEATLPSNEQYAEMICKACMEKNEFLHDYSDIAVNTESTEVDVTSVNNSDIPAADITSENDIPKTNGMMETTEASDDKETKMDTDAEMTETEIKNDVELPKENGEDKVQNADESSAISTESTGEKLIDDKEPTVPDTTDEDKTDLPVPDITNITKDDDDSKQQSDKEIEAPSETENLKQDKTTASASGNNDSKAEGDTNDAASESKVKDNETRDVENVEDKDATQSEENKTETNSDPSEEKNAGDKNDSNEDSLLESIEKLENELGKKEENEQTQTDLNDRSNNDNDKTETKDENSITTDVASDKLESDSKVNEEDKLDSAEPTTNEIEMNEAKADDENKASEDKKPETTENDHNDTTEVSKPSDETSNELEAKTEESTKDSKRKLSTEDLNEISIKKPKLEETSGCCRPRGVKRVFKGATFWPSNFRQKLCTCNECITMYKDLSVLFLTDPEDTVSAYEALGKQRIDGSASTQYERGLEALSSLDRTHQINALTEFNKMRDKLLDFLKSFKDRKEVVKEEDIKAFFAGMKPKREPDGVYFCR